jgi:hypothetical protein
MGEMFNNRYVVVRLPCNPAYGAQNDLIQGIPSDYMFVYDTHHVSEAQNVIATLGHRHPFTVAFERAKQNWLTHFSKHHRGVSPTWHMLLTTGEQHFAEQGIYLLNENIKLSCIRIDEIVGDDSETSPTQLTFPNWQEPQQNKSSKRQ